MSQGAAYARAMSSRGWIETRTGRMGHAVTDSMISELLSLSTSLARIIDAPAEKIAELEKQIETVAGLAADGFNSIKTICEG